MAKTLPSGTSSWANLIVLCPKYAPHSTITPFFSGDISKVGTIRASHLDYLRSIANKYYERYEDRKFFLLGVWELIEKELSCFSRNASERYSYLSQNTIVNNVNSFLSIEENLKSKAQLPPHSERKRHLDTAQTQNHDVSRSTDRISAEGSRKNPNDFEEAAQTDNEKKNHPTNVGANKIAPKISFTELPDFSCLDSSLELEKRELKVLITWFGQWFEPEHKALVCREMMKGLFDENIEYIDLLLTDFKRTVSLEQYVKTLKASIKEAIGTCDKNKAA